MASSAAWTSSSTTTPGCGPSHAAPMTAATPSSTRTCAPGPSSGSGSGTSSARPASSGSRSEASARRWGGTHGAASRRRSMWLTASRSSSTIGPYGRPASSSWQRAASTTAPRLRALAHELVRQPRLPDPGLPLDHGQAAIRLGAGVGVDERRQLARPVPPAAARAALRAAWRRAARWSGASASRRRGQGPVVHLLVEGHRLLERPDAELLAQRPDALAVLLECCRAVAAPGVQADQLAMGGLVERIELEPAPGVRNRLLVVAASDQPHPPGAAARRPARAPARPPRRPASRRSPGCRAARSPRGSRAEKSVAASLSRFERGAVGRELAEALDVELETRPSHQGDAVAGGLDPLLADRLAQRRQRAPERTRARARDRDPATAARRAPRASAAARQAPDGRAAPWPCACRR